MYGKGRAGEGGARLQGFLLLLHRPHRLCLSELGKISGKSIAKAQTFSGDFQPEPKPRIVHGWKLLKDKEAARDGGMTVR